MISCAYGEDGRRHHLRRVGPTKLGDHLESDPSVRGGEPRIAGTRLTVWTVAARLNDGDPLGVMFIALDVPPWRKRVARWLGVDAAPLKTGS